MLNPRFVDRESFVLAGVTACGQLGEIDYAGVWNKQFMPVASRLHAISPDAGSYGASFGEKGKTVYLAGVAVTGDTELPAGFVKRILPAAHYAVFDCTLATLNLTGEEVYSQWFNDAGMELDAEAVGFEYYLPYNEVGDMLVQLYIPVKPKQSTSAEKHGGIMSVFDVISERRSIRKYKNDPVPGETLRRILQAGLLAPSGANRQTWKFYVVQGKKRDEMVDVLKKALDNREKEGENVAGARHSFEIMAQAPVNVFVFRPNRKAPWLASTISQNFSDIVDIQSVGAAIENMLLEAHELGIGSLWVCDVFSACNEISAWLGEETELIASVCLGIANEHPAARKRKTLDEAVEWLS